jgi:fermentation-respiration switch protein FrsA (DUF1100 family)
MRTALASGLLIVAGLKLLVWWIEPRMAFFPIRGVQETPAAAQLAFTDVSIRTEDGETLHAWWLEHPEPVAQVVFFHGNGGNLSLWLDVIAGLRRHGCSVLAVDYRGYGASTGRPTEKGLYRDATAAVRAFTDRHRRPGSPVVYWGRSIGSPVAASVQHLGADGLVLESPFPSMRSIFSGNPIMRVLTLFSSYGFPTSRFLRDYRGALLVIHGDADTIIPFRAGRRVFDDAPTARKTFVAVPGADHNDLHIANPSVYWRAVDAFLKGLSSTKTRALAPEPR